MEAISNLRGIARLKGLFLAEPGVEPVDWTPDKPLPGTALYGSVAWERGADGAPDYDRPIRLNDRPTVSVSYRDPADEAATVGRALAGFRALVAGRDPAGARPLPHVTLAGHALAYFPLRVDGWPVRVVLDYSVLKLCMVLKLDTLCPRGASAEVA